MKAPAKIRVARPLPSEVPWTPPFEYECSTGRHSFGSDHPLDSACPMCVDGFPCDGTLVRFGRGSKSDRS